MLIDYKNTIHQPMSYTLLSMDINDEIASLLNSHFIVTAVFLIAAIFLNW